MSDRYQKKTTAYSSDDTGSSCRTADDSFPAHSSGRRTPDGRMTGGKKPDRFSRTAKALLVLIVIGIVGKAFLAFFPFGADISRLENVSVPGWIDVQIIEIDGASRRGENLSRLSDIVIHYVGNPGSTAQQNRDYFNSPESSVSSHFVVGLEGEIIQCIPLNEISSASNDRNRDTISIEVCHPDESGKFTDASYRSLIRLAAWLCDIGGLHSDDIIRHYDITGKLCPLYYVEHEDAWHQLKSDVARSM